MVPHSRRIFALLPTLVALAASPALGAVPQVDQAFLDEERIWVDTVASGQAAAVSNAVDAAEALRALLGHRAEALTRLNLTSPLTTADGLETQDLYDDMIIRAANRVIQQAKTLDLPEPTGDDAIYFASMMEAPPALGGNPVGFMTLGMVALGVRANHDLADDPAITVEASAQLTLRIAAAAVNNYLEAHVDELARYNANQFRHNAVIMRLRCPKDDGTYRLSNQKNKLRNGNQFSTIYFLKCNICYEEVELEYPVAYVTRLQEVSEPQDLKKEPEAARPAGGVDP